MNRPTELLDPPRDTDLEALRDHAQGDNEDRTTSAPSPSTTHEGA